MENEYQSALKAASLTGTRKCPAEELTAAELAASALEIDIIVAKWKAAQPWLFRKDAL